MNEALEILKSMREDFQQALNATYESIDYYDKYEAKLDAIDDAIYKITYAIANPETPD